MAKRDHRHEGKAGPVHPTRPIAQRRHARHRTANAPKFDGILTNKIDFNNQNELPRSKLVELKNHFASRKFDKAHVPDDLFGDAYEYLMQMYASTAGKSGGEFYTPQEVSELLARIAVSGRTEVNKVYDPACGSGSLLLKFAKVLGQDKVRQGFFGQEVNLTTYNLCRINMFLQDVNYEKFDIAHGDTLTDPAHRDDEPFEAIVSNPPYSIGWAGDSNPLLINDPRFATPADRVKNHAELDAMIVAWTKTRTKHQAMEQVGSAGQSAELAKPR